MEVSPFKKPRAWICNSNSAFELYFIDAEEKSNIRKICRNKMDHQYFNPFLTYFMFGDDEQIFGYKDLSVKLFYIKSSMRLYYDISYSAVYENTVPIDGSSKRTFDEIADKPVDVESVLKSYLERGYTNNLDDFIKETSKEPSVKPFGELVCEFQHTIKINKDGNVDENNSIENDLTNEDLTLDCAVYKCDFSTPGFIEYYDRFKLITCFYIEAATFLETDDDRWVFLILYEKVNNGKDVFNLAGFVSVCRFFGFPEFTKARVSQFVIFPHYHKIGLGSKFYQEMYDHFLKDKNIKSITVEDPNESFTDMRDVSDLIMLKKNGVFQMVNEKSDQEVLDTMTNKLKLSKLQSRKCLELIKLSRLDRENPQDYKLFRLSIKKRLYLHYKDDPEGLNKMKKTDRISKLHSLYTFFEQEYSRVLEKFWSL